MDNHHHHDQSHQDMNGADTDRVSFVFRPDHEKSDGLEEAEEHQPRRSPHQNVFLKATFVKQNGATDKRPPPRRSPRHDAPCIGREPVGRNLVKDKQQLYVRRSSQLAWSDAARSSRASSATTKSSISSKTSKKKSVRVGTRVYCKYRRLGYFLGRITRVIRNAHSSYDSYAVEFEDGVVLDDVSRNKFYTLDEAVKRGIAPKKADTARSRAATGGKRKASDCAMPVKRRKNEGSTHWLYEKRCGQCPLCIRSDCGACVCCLRNSANSSSSYRECCVQKMCVHIPVQKKAQSSKNLPENWKYFFGNTEKRDNNERKSRPRPEIRPGLRILSPAGRLFRSVESAMIQNGRLFQELDMSDFQAFYAEIGLVSSREREHEIAKGDKAYSPVQLMKKRCGTCALCTRPSCGRCTSCRNNQEAGREKECCFQKMCCRIPSEMKAQPAPGFPPQWRFKFDDTIKRDKVYNCSARPNAVLGLRILPPGKTSRQYRSFEGVMGSVGSHLVKQHNISPEKLKRCFYKHIGAVHANSLTPPIRCGQGKRVESRARRRGRTPVDEVLRRLHKTRCQKCIMCLRSDCGTCFACQPSRRKHVKKCRKGKECCLRKMCAKIPEPLKALPAPGFSDGWRFIFCPTFDNDERHRNHKDPCIVPGLRILSESDKRRFRSVECVLRRYKRQLEISGVNVEMLSRTFYDYIGEVKMYPSAEASSVESTTVRSTVVSATLSNEMTTFGELEDTLVGKPICEQWVDVNGSIKVIYGEVCESHGRGVGRDFTVTYSSQSRSCLSAMRTDSAAEIPETRRWNVDRVLGSVLSYEDRMNVSLLARNDVRALLPLQWLVPDVRHEQLIESSDGRQRFPRLIMVFRGYQLEINVKESTIPNAGNGAFLKCSPMDARQQEIPLVLQPGELLDCGVYAPFLPQDRKSKALFLLKDFVFQDCATFVFNSLDERFQLDITDDLTGELHDVAKMHIPAFVNESNDAVPTIHANYDVEGNVHYLLGHDEVGAGPLAIPSDRSETELTINYGPSYEAIRVKKGYSTLSEDRKQAILAEYVQGSDAYYCHIVLQTFTWNDLDVCANHLLDVFTRKPDYFYRPSVLKRALIGVVLLHRRARRLPDEFVARQSQGRTQRCRDTLRKLFNRLLRPCVGSDSRDRQELRLLLAQGQFDILEENVLQAGGLMEVIEQCPSDDDDDSIVNNDCQDRTIDQRHL